MECREGKWLFTDRYGVEREKAEGPFAQVIGNMFSLKTVLKQRFPANPHIGNILCASGVVFPDIEFKSCSQEIIPEMIYDRRTDDITDYMERVFDYWQGRGHREPSKLSPLDYLLKGGFEKGNWAVFYDKHQNIYNPEYLDGVMQISTYPNITHPRAGFPEVYVHRRNESEDAFVCDGECAGCRCNGFIEWISGGQKCPLVL